MPKVSIVCVTHNSKAYLPDLLKSLEVQQGVDWNLIVVDNASTDGSLEVLEKAHLQEVRVFKNQQNLGFAAGANIGIKAALESGATHVLLVNPDVILAPDCLVSLLKSLEGRSGIVQPKIYLAGSDNRINTFGTKVHYLGLGYCGSYGKEELTSNIDHEIPAASGACMLVSRAVFEEIGYLDESFFMYLEDQDFSWRARLNGFPIMLSAKARAWHHYDAGRLGRKKLYYLERNRLRFVLKNYGWNTIFLLLPAALVFEIAMLCYSLLTGWIHYKLWSYLDTILHIVTILKKRFEIQGKRKILDSALKTYWSAELSLEGWYSAVWQGLFNPLASLYWKLVRKLI